MATAPLIEVTPLAAEKLQEVIKDHGEDGSLLRVMVMPGQNGGMQYVLGVEKEAKDDDFVIATGLSHSVRELVDTAFRHVGLDWKNYVQTDPKLLRPAEVEHLIGNADLAKAKLGWAPEVDFKGLVRMMVDADMERVSAKG